MSGRLKGPVGESMSSYILKIDEGKNPTKKGGVFMRVHLPDNGGMTMIENTFIDQFMPSSSGDFVKIYLYLLRCAQNGQSDVSITRIADALHYTESDVRRAVGYWQKNKCLDLIEDPEESSAGSGQVRADEYPGNAPGGPAAQSGSKITEFRPAQKYSKEDLRRLVFVAESYLGRPLSPPEQETLIYFLSDLGMDADLVDYLLDYCISMNHTSFRYIQKVAVNWTDQGITTVEQARRDGTSIKDEYFTIFRAFGIRDHVPTPSEKEYMDRWMNSYCLPVDVILMACDRTVLQTGKASFAYADSIMKSWSDNKVRSSRDIEKLDHIHELAVSRSQQASDRTQSRINASAGRFINFEASGTDWDAVADSVIKAQEQQTRILQES